MTCDLCNKETHFGHAIKHNGNYITVCSECNTKKWHSEIDDGLKRVERASDFKDWSSSDLSEAFWIHLAEYKKNRNERSLDIMIRALLWAQHADHGLSNSFSNALKWCGIDWYEEQKEFRRQNNKK